MRSALGIDIADVTGGYRVFRAAALRNIELSGVASHGYCFQVDLVWRALQHGLRVVETPITFTERVHGDSKMSGSIVRESLVRVTLWGLRRRMQGVGELALRRLPSVKRTSHRVPPSRAAPSRMWSA